MPRLTIGMAHYDDYDGAYFTIQNLRAHHDVRDVEFLVVDNRPDSEHAKHLRDLLKGISGSKYVPLPDAVGTSIPRDRVFREATAPAVLCVDCHVILPRALPDGVGSIRRLLEYWEEHPDSRDMVTGPLLNDSFGLYATHFNDQWRAEMWGTWGMAWACPCGWHFSPLELDGDQLVYVDLIQQARTTTCPQCQRKLPVIGWSGHERKLVDAGFVCLAAQPHAAPFEIPGMGLGLFSMRKDAWVGFHPDARGFGGEELYVHAKVRGADGRVLCMPWLTWVHRFGRPGGANYPAPRQAKVRNYVLEFVELGRDLAPIRAHFVDSGLLPAAEWERLVANPLAFEHRVGPSQLPLTQSNLPQPPIDHHTLDTLFAWCAALPRDLNKHAGKIRELASRVSHVTTLVKRREWDVFLLAGRPDDLVTYTSERDLLHDKLHEVVQRTETNPKASRRLKNYTVHYVPDVAAVQQIDLTDLLVIDSVHHADRLYAELTRFAPQAARWILLRGTQAFGEVAEGGNGPGLLPALRRFMREHPEWSVIYHSTEQYGLTLISRDPSDKPKPPGLVTLASNFAQAMAAHVADGLTKVSAEQLEARLQVCTLCDQRRDTRCAVCGCFTEPKAGMRSSDCPLGKWPSLEV